MKEIIQVNELTKYFDGVKAVDHISFQVDKGELFGFLGPNGAGKTTTIKMLTGLAKPTSGTAYIDGIDIGENPKNAQCLMGVVPDESNLYPELTGFDNLTFCASLYGLSREERKERARELLEMFNLDDAADRKFETYSKGMKRKLTIAAGIIHSPSVLFLDEPTTGIDVSSARQIRQMIADMHNQGTTIFLTTHYIEEAERLCEKIAFIVKGKIVKSDRVSDLLKPIKNDHILEIALNKSDGGILRAAEASFPDFSFDSLPGYIIRISSNKPIPVSSVINLFESSGSEVLEAKRITPSLEDIFVKVTGIEASEMENGKNKKGNQS